MHATSEMSHFETIEEEDEEDDSSSTTSSVVPIIRVGSRSPDSIQMIYERNRDRNRRDKRKSPHSITSGINEILNSSSLGTLDSLRLEKEKSGVTLAK